MVRLDSAPCLNMSNGLVRRDEIVIPNEKGG